MLSVSTDPMDMDLDKPATGRDDYSAFGTHRSADLLARHLQRRDGVSTATRSFVLRICLRPFATGGLSSQVWELPRQTGELPRASSGALLQKLGSCPAKVRSLTCHGPKFKSSRKGRRGFPAAAFVYRRNRTMKSHNWVGPRGPPPGVISDSFRYIPLNPKPGAR